ASQRRPPEVSLEARARASRNLYGVVGRVDELLAVRLFPVGSFDDDDVATELLRRAFRARLGFEGDLLAGRAAAQADHARTAPLVRENFERVFPLLAGVKVAGLDGHLAPLRAPVVAPPQLDLDGEVFEFRAADV